MIALALGRNVELWPQSTARYGSGRLVRTAFKDGMDVGLNMLEDGLAWVYNITEAPTQLQRIYLDAQRRARDHPLADGRIRTRSRLGTFERRTR
jgi:endonuclease YncB( thermonuclease family)